MSDEIKRAFDTLKAAMVADPEYAWGWFCNLSMPIMDVTRVSHEKADKAGAHLMHHLFDYDITTHPHYQGAPQVTPLREGEPGSILGSGRDETNPGNLQSIFGEKRSAVSARILVNAEPTEAMMMAGVSAIIDAGLDGPDGVGMADAAAVWRAMNNAALSQSLELGAGERE